MKIREIGTIFVCWLSVMTGMAQNWAGRLGQFLDESPLLETSEVGVMVYDLTSDSLVFAHQPISCIGRLPQRRSLQPLRHWLR